MSPMSVVGNTYGARFCVSSFLDTASKRNRQSRMCGGIPEVYGAMKQYVVPSHGVIKSSKLFCGIRLKHLE